MGSEGNIWFKYVSLFSGIGGFEQALNGKGGICVMASEVDKYANTAYELIYGKKTVGDITKVRSMDVPRHDILTAGFPCPTFSVAGGRDGMMYKCINPRCKHEFVIDFERYKMRNVRCTECCDEAKPKDIRGMLFYEVARVAEYAQPKVVLMENVKGLISSAKGETMRVIAETMNKIGYVIDFESINSKYFDVAQNRERIFVVCVRKDLVQSEEWRIKGKNVVANCKRNLLNLGVQSFNFDFPAQEDVNVSLIDILEESVDKRFYIKEDASAEILKMLDANGLPDMVGKLETDCIGRIDVKGHDILKRVYSPNGVSPALTTMQGGNQEPKVAVLEATKKGYAVAGVGDSINIKFPSSKTRRGRVGHGVCHTLETTNYLVTLTHEWKVRKITPKECFRLQGFRDEIHELLHENGISNAQLYKTAGNAVTVNVISALMDKIIEGGYI
ncbi:DNA (cytosine-5-)-methyltransferase [Bacillus mycoides]|uniref:Cytosine-specific methyltransferase n=1 Tax=Bacillus mycoides (strain KBAB4) TaxID=315730 RepID=A9VVN1_BACMK|nr:DNA (cytosine-5-)-methyltransferase [Bacillus mycoides]ABY46846.1 DNA-cytosine methyltransferase [Bacillus mycoides KBAB4]